MSYSIKPGSIFGRIGTGVGKGLAEQLPKEIERQRLSAGLKELGNQEGLSPFQQFSQLAAIPGITPQMIQSGSELLKQQGVGEGLRKLGNQDQSQNQPSPFPKAQNIEGNEGKSITTTAPVLATTTPYIPKTREQILERGGELYDTQRQLYPNPQSAIDAAEKEDQQNQSISQALQAQRKGQQDVQSRVQNELREQAKNAGVEIPDNVYSPIEDEAIEAVNSGKMTELEAGKHFKKELDKISRQYKAIETVGDIDYMIRDKKDIKRNLKEIQKGFKERNDLENFADSLISKNKISPSKAYYLAFPPSEYKELNNALVKIPSVNQLQKKYVNQDISFPEIEQKIKDETFKVSEKLAQAMGKEASPLAIGEELEAKGYNSDVWFDYLGKNRKKLDLSERQGRELEKPRNNIPTLNDFWLFYFSGLEKLVEQQ